MPSQTDADRRIAQQAYLDSLGELSQRKREFDRLIAYHAGHMCRRCQVAITDHEFIAAGLFFSLCGPCLAGAKRTLRQYGGDNL